jgi:hypothetical protein
MHFVCKYSGHKQTFEKGRSFGHPEWFRCVSNCSTKNNTSVDNRKPHTAEKVHGMHKTYECLLLAAWIQTVFWSHSLSSCTLISYHESNIYNTDVLPEPYFSLVNIKSDVFKNSFMLPSKPIPLISSLCLYLDCWMMTQIKFLSQSVNVTSCSGFVLSHNWAQMVQLNCFIKGTYGVMFREGWVL